jgi:Ser/Thr protein kinase RdoA (MazF antagonist)
VDVEPHDGGAQEEWYKDRSKGNNVPEAWEIEPDWGRPVVDELMRSWGGAAPKFIRNFVNLVYRLEERPPFRYLRITPETHRSEDQIVSELAVVEHLGRCGLPASQPLPAADGRLIEVVQSGGARHFACVFDEARGDPPSAQQFESPAFFRAAGHLMGTLHRELGRFERPAGFRRFPWDADRWVRFAELVPRRERAAWALYDDLRSRLAVEATDESVFGLIHGDFTTENMRVEEGRITLFDFDASCDHWYAYEIAMFLHFFGGREPQVREMVYGNVLEGYAEARPASVTLRRHIPWFGKMRLLYSFLVFAERWGFDNLSPQQQQYFELRRKLFESPPTWPSP